MKTVVLIRIMANIYLRIWVFHLGALCQLFHLVIEYILKILNKFVLDDLFLELLWIVSIGDQQSFRSFLIWSIDALFAAFNLIQSRLKVRISQPLDDFKVLEVRNLLLQVLRRLVDLLNLLFNALIALFWAFSKSACTILIKHRSQSLRLI